MQIAAFDVGKGRLKGGFQTALNRVRGRATHPTACGLRVLRRTRLPSFKGRLKAGLRASAPFPPMRDNVSESSVSAKAKRYNQTASNGKNACAAEPYPTTYGLRLLTGGEFDPAGIAGRQAIF